MNYTETLNDPTLLSGFSELLNDPDALVIKRTIRVFSNVYNHSLRLLSEDQISEETFLKAWPYLADVIDNMFKMFSSTENEGVILILVKFLECSVDRNLISDFSRYTDISHKSREYIKRGLRALKDLVLTPYVGGSVFIVAVKAIIRIACLREDLHEPVSNLVKKLIDSLPPTLFDHNVRSFNKMLQFNLFRLLKKTDCPILKKKLIEMMISTGGSRKSLLPWTPKEIAAPKRKIPQYNIDDVILGRVSPPSNKKLKLESEGNALIEQEVEIHSSLKTKSLLISEPPRTGLQFLTSLIPKALSSNPIQSSNVENQEISKKLLLPKVCSLILPHLQFLPDAMPSNFANDFAEKTIVSENIDVMRNHLGTMLAGIFDEEQLNSFSCSTTTLKLPTTTTEKSYQPQAPVYMKDGDNAIVDVDMRNVDRKYKELQDVDMRVMPTLTNTKELQSSPGIINPSNKTCNLYSDIPPQEDIETKGVRRDPRLKNVAQKKSPSPEASPIGISSPQRSPDESQPKEVCIGRLVNKDPRLQNRAAQRPRTPPEIVSKENFNQEQRLTNSNSMNRDPQRNTHILSEHESQMNNHHSLLPMSFHSNVQNHVAHNLPYAAGVPMSMNFPNQCQDIVRDQRRLRPQFEGQLANPSMMFINYNRGPRKNFRNPYQQGPHRRFQQL